MDILKLVKFLREKFSKNRFFVRVYHIENDIVIYNDVDIVLKYDFGLFKNIDNMVKTIMGDVIRKINDKYNIPKDMVSDT